MSMCIDHSRNHHTAFAVFTVIGTRPFLPAPLLESSGRRWDRDGALATIVLMWTLRLRYFLGADPAALARAYHGR